MSIEYEFLKREFEWMQNREYYMGLEAEHPISSNEIYEDFVNHEWEDGFTLEERLKIQYAQEVLIPMVFRGEVPVKEVEIVKNRLEDFCKLLNKHNLLNDKIAA